MKNERYTYEAPVVEILDVECERLCTSPMDNGVKRNDYDEVEW